MEGLDHARRGTQIRSVLVDFGYTPEALINNIELLGINPARLDALVLSHGHYDHFGGLVGFIQKYRSKLPAKLPFFVGGEDCFCSREWTGPRSAPWPAQRWARHVLHRPLRFNHRQAAG